MNRLIAGLAVALAAAAISIPAVAAEAPSKEQAAPQAAAKPGPGAKPMDCSKVRNKDKERCEARNKALEECKDAKSRKEHRECMAKEMKEYAEESKPAAKTK